MEAGASEVVAAVRSGIEHGDSAALAAVKEALFRVAVADGEAAWLAGQLFAKGLGVPRDLVRAGFWYEGADALGHADAAYELALLDTRPERRAEHLARAAARGSHRAMWRLGAEARSADPAAAALWFERAAAAGNGRAAASLGRMAEAGLVAGGPDAARAWFARAEALDCPWWEFSD